MPYPRGRDQALPTTMPFGKHKGVKLTELEGKYIDWLLTDFEGLRPPLKAALQAEQRRRETGEPRRPTENDSTDAGTREPAVAAKPQTASTTEDRIRRIVRQEMASLFKRLGAALEREK